MSRAPVAIIGASGYAGAELLRLLLEHPEVEVATICAKRAAGKQLADVYPQFAGRLELTLDSFDPDAIANRAGVAFAALPHGASAETVAALRERGVSVIDLSADFRLHDAGVYNEWYGDHRATDRLSEAVYGLPERHRDAIARAKLVASPGCYPTGAILAIAPLLAAGAVAPSGVIVDAKSGASGAGRSPSLALHFPEAAEGVRAYKVGGLHPHTPEIEQELSEISGTDVKLTFTPHLVPISRGIFTCVYATPTDPSKSVDDYRRVLDDAYADEPFVSVLQDGRIPDTNHVYGSNRAHVAVAFDARANRVIAMSAIDNLVKGAAGQAVQCLNLMMGWPEVTALEAVGLFP